MEPAVVVAIVTAGLAAIASIYNTFISRRKQDAEASARIVEATAALMDDLRDQVVAANNRACNLERKADELTQRVEVLHETAARAMMRIDALEESERRLLAANREMGRKLERHRQIMKKIAQVAEILSEAITTAERLVELLRAMLVLFAEMNDEEKHIDGGE